MTFDQCIEFVLKHEGGYVNHPEDPGGETNFGISKRAFPGEDIPHMTRARAVEIYREHYWDAIDAESLPADMRLPAFDCAVNQGVSFSKGVIALTRGYLEPTERFLAHRALRYAKSSLLLTFGFGWMRRLFSVALEVGRRRTP